MSSAEKPYCPRCLSTTDVTDLVVGPRGEYGRKGWICMDCDVVMDESASETNRVENLGEFRGMERGVYLHADNPRKAIPLITEGGGGDWNLLQEIMEENGYVIMEKTDERPQ